MRFDMKNPRKTNSRRKNVFWSCLITSSNGFSWLAAPQPRVLDKRVSEKVNVEPAAHELRKSCAAQEYEKKTKQNPSGSDTWEIKWDGNDEKRSMVECFTTGFCFPFAETESQVPVAELRERRREEERQTEKEGERMEQRGRERQRRERMGPKQRQ